MVRVLSLTPSASDDLSRPLWGGDRRAPPSSGHFSRRRLARTTGRIFAAGALIGRGRCVPRGSVVRSDLPLTEPQHGDVGLTTRR